MNDDDANCWGSTSLSAIFQVSQDNRRFFALVDDQIYMMMERTKPDQLQQ